MLFYRAALPLSGKTLNYAAGIIRRHRKWTGSRWRKLNPGQQALLVLAYLRKGRDVRRAGGRVRSGNDAGVAVRGRGRRPARGPGAQAPPGGPGREASRARLRGP